MLTVNYWGVAAMALFGLVSGLALYVTSKPEKEEKEATEQQ